MKATDEFKKTIKDYLEKRGSKDPLFAKIVQKPGKNMDDCITYILSTVQKSGCNGFTDDEVYSMAIHYFDEDKIEVGNVSNCQVVVNHTVELTEADRAEARQKALDQLVEQEKKNILAREVNEKEKTAKALEKKEEKKKELIKKSEANTLFTDES
jgi:hypothetical protein